MKYAKVMGIDLGTTFTCVGVYNLETNEVEIVPNEQGHRITPSCVAYCKDEILIGEPALEQIVFNPKNTIVNSKRLIGKNFDDPDLQKDIEYCSYKVSRENNKPMIEVAYKNDTAILNPEDVASLILKKVTCMVADYTCLKIKKAVITVPAYFSNVQKKATKRAGELAGLEVIKIINEPMAAALYYTFINKRNIESHEENILIYDLGGGTLDISVCEIKGGRIKVKSKSGDTHLGGEDFNNLLVETLLSDINRKYRLNLKNNLTDDGATNEIDFQLRRVHRKAEDIKKRLSFKNEITIDFSNILFNQNMCLSRKIKRTEFEVLCEKLFEKSIQLVEDAVRESKISKNNISNVVLVGGSTRIPMIKKLLSNCFNGKEIYNKIQPDEAVAYGAAFHAACLVGSTGQEIEIMDTVSLSIGIGIKHGKMHRVIPRNTHYPVKREAYYSTAYDNQTSCAIRIYEGERDCTINNHFLGDYRLTKIPPMPKGRARIKNTYEIDSSGILIVSSLEKISNTRNKITINPDDYQLDQESVEQMLEDAEINKNKDKRTVLRAREIGSLDETIYKFKRSALYSHDNHLISKAAYQTINQEISDVSEWLEENHNLEPEEYIQRKIYLETIAKERGVSFYLDVYGRDYDNTNTIVTSISSDSEVEELEGEDEWCNIDY